MRRPALRALRRDLGGASALEFALVAPIMLFLIIGLIQVSLWLFASHVLNELLSIGARTLYFDMNDKVAAATATRNAADARYLNGELLKLEVTRYETPFPRLELSAIYPFTGIGFGLPGGKLDITAAVSVAIAE